MSVESGDAARFRGNVSRWAVREIDSPASSDTFPTQAATGVAR